MLVLKYSKISWIVFALSLIIVIISLIPVIFPALISETVTVSDLEKIGIVPYEKDPYEIGLLTITLIFVNIIIFTTYFLRNKLPLGISKLFKELFLFEISKKITLIIITILLVMYVLVSAGELSTEETLQDYVGVKNRLKTWSIDQISSFKTHVRYFVL